ncbi:MAG TPA: STAS domain-containing protein [Nocardioides sp.]|uniref:STAS domain-containing protein n=1 Tax=Nocardioides sp. TaxID=35761 RepID=UPI002ED8809F
MAAFTTSLDGGVAVVRISGELDIASHGELLAHTEPLLRSDAKVVALDVADVTFIDSSGLGALVRLQQQAVDAGRSLRLRNPPRPVTRILSLTGLADLFPTDTDQ